MVPFLPSFRTRKLKRKGCSPCQNHCIMFSSGMLEKTIRGNLLHWERELNITHFSEDKFFFSFSSMIYHALFGSLISFALWSAKRMHCNKEVSVAFLLPNFLSFPVQMCKYQARVPRKFVILWRRSNSDYSPTGHGNKVCSFLLSNSQVGPVRTVKQEQEEISPNHVQAFIPGSV